MKNIKRLKIFLPIFLLILLPIIFYNIKISLHKKIIIDYKSFISMADKGEISKVAISTDQLIKFVDKNGSTFYTYNPRSTDFKEYLLLKGINVSESENSLASVAPPIISLIMILSLFYYFYRKTNSKGNAFKLSTIDAAEEKNCSITYSDIAGNAEAKESMMELIDFIKNPENYSRYNVRVPRGVLLYGPPGTGKTLMAKALSGEANVPFFAVNGSDFVQIYVGVGAGRIRDLFKKAKEKGKAVIFIDEIDAIGKKRDGRADGGSDEREQTLNALLSEMSGFKESSGIIVVAATNRMDVLDEALLRPGRFDRKIEIGLPDVNARHQILKLYAEKKPMSEKVDLYELAKKTVYFSGAKLENLMNEAAIIAAREKSDFICDSHLERAFTNIIAGFEKKDKSYIKDDERRITAYHEAGHAIATLLLMPENKISKITIIPGTKGFGGYTLSIPPDCQYHTKIQLINNIKVSLAGRCAEEIIFGRDKITTGAYGDIKKATEVLMSMIRNYGMFDDSGLLDYDYITNGTVSKDIISQGKETINKLYNEVIELLRNNIDMLKSLTDSLLERETLNEKEILEVIKAR